MKRLYYGTLWLCLFLVYTAVQNPGYLDISDAQERFAAMLALVKTGRPLISTFFRPEPFAPIYSIGPGLAALPFFVLGKLWMLTGLADMPERQVMLWMTLHGAKAWTAAWMCLTSAMAGLFGASRRGSLLMALGVGLCTLVFPYTKTFQSENLVGLWISTLVYALVRWRRGGDWRWLLAAGGAYGMALTTKLELAVAAPLLGLWILAAARRGGAVAVTRSWLTFGAAVLPGVAVVFWYNWLRFGGILTDGYESQGFTHPLLSGLFLIWLSPGKGLLWYCPLLLVAVPLIPRFVRRHRMDGVLCMGLVAVMNLLYAKWHSPAGETSLGARFMVSYLPLLMLPLLELPAMARSWSPARMAAGMAAVAGLGLNLLFCSVSFVLYHSRRWNNAPNEPLERMRAVWENWYVPGYSPLVGLRGLLSEGLLDLYFIRLRPVEQFLLVLPGLYWVMAGALAAAGMAWVAARLMDSGRPGADRPTYVPALLFTGSFFFLVMGVAGLTTERVGLTVVFERDGWATYETKSRAVAVKDFQESAAFHVMGAADFTATWDGTFEVKEAGDFEFRLKAVNSATLHIDGGEIATATGAPFTDPAPVFARVPLEAGRHRLRLVYRQPEIQGQVELKWKRPGDDSFRSLRSGDLRAK